MEPNSDTNACYQAGDVYVHQVKTRKLWNSTLEFYFGEHFATETLSRYSDADFSEFKPIKKKNLNTKP